MKVPTEYECFLQYVPGGKGIPYNGGPRPNGDTNHGFRSLKGLADDVIHVPETENDPALARFLKLVNEDDTAFFTVGCVSGMVKDAQGFRMSGYVEFCINDRRHVNEATNYFHLFWGFVRSLEERNFAERVVMHWELLGATFIEKNAHGMTCTVMINTHFFEAETAAYSCWERTLELLGQHLTQQRGTELDRIF
jgi:hypothetical protein